jgi:hypothetical protein
VFEVALAVFIAIVVCDAAGGVRAARAEARGEHATVGRQLARGLGLLLGATAVGGGAGLAPRILRARRVVPYQLSCTSHSIIIENRSAGPREVALGSLQLDVGYWKPDVRDLRGGFVNGLLGQRLDVRRIAPDERAVFSSGIGNDDAYRCGFTSFGDGNPAPHTRSCRYRFAFAARKVGVADDEWVEAYGSCQPELDAEGFGRLDDAPPAAEAATGARQGPSEE